MARIGARSMNRSAKGRAREYKTMRLMESAGSKGAFNVIALSGTDLVAIQCKSNSWPSAVEVEAMKLFPLPPHSRRLIHRWDDGARMPLVKELS